MFNRFLQCVLMLALMVSCSSKNPTGFVQPDDPAGKLVVTKNKAGGKVKRGRTTTSPTVSLSISLAPDSPTGLVPAGATGVTLAKLHLKAKGGCVILDFLPILSVVTSDNDIDNGKVYLDGIQIGSTTDLNDVAPIAFRFGTTAIIPSDTVKVLEVRGDIKDADGINHNKGDLVQITLGAGFANARGLESGLPISTPAVSGNILTVDTGTLSVWKNTVWSDRSAANPSGVAGGVTGVFLGSFGITAGAGEGSDIPLITMADDVKSPGSLGQGFYNLRLVSGGPADANGNYAAGTLIGNIVGTLSQIEDQAYDFIPEPAIALEPNQQIAVNAYAAPLSSGNFGLINGDRDGVIYPSTVAGIGWQTGQMTNGSMGRGLHRVYIAEHGALNTVVGGGPEARVVLAGATNQLALELMLEANAAEGIGGDKIVIPIVVKDRLGNVQSQPMGVRAVHLHIGQEVVATALPTTRLSSGDPTLKSGISGVAEFSLERGWINIPQNGGSWYGFEIDVASEAVLPWGYTIQLGVAYDLSAGSDLQPSIKGYGLESSAAISASVFGQTNDWLALGNEITVVQAYPEVVRFDLPSTTLAAGATSQKVLARWGVRAVGGASGASRALFYITWTEATPTREWYEELALGNFKLYRNGALMARDEYRMYLSVGGPGGTIELDDYSALRLSTFADHGHNWAKARLNVVFNEVIEDSATNVYDLKSDIRNAHVGSATDADDIMVQLISIDPWSPSPQPLDVWHLSK